MYYGLGRLANTQDSTGKIGGVTVPDKIRVETDTGMWFKLITDVGIGYRGFSLSWNIEGITNVYIMNFSFKCKKTSSVDTYIFYFERSDF